MVQGFPEDFFFGLYLAGVLQVLPVTTAAGPEVGAWRVGATFGRKENIHGPGVDMVLFLTSDSSQDPVSRGGKGDKYYLAFMAPHSGSTVNELVYFNFDCVRFLFQFGHFKGGKS
jgi:hypothetical protein